LVELALDSDAVAVVFAARIAAIDAEAANAARFAFAVAVVGAVLDERRADTIRAARRPERAVGVDDATDIAGSDAEAVLHESSVGIEGGALAGLALGAVIIGVAAARESDADVGGAAELTEATVAIELTAGGARADAQAADAGLVVDAVAVVRAAGDQHGAFVGG
jgi:hypothetical protein